MKIHVSKNGIQLGPYTLEEIKNLAATGKVAPADWAYYDGAADWVPLSQVPGFSAFPAPTPATAAPAAAPAPARFSSMADTVPSGRPVLVWIICVAYFIFGAIEIAGIAATPSILSSTHAAMEKEAYRTEMALAHTPDPADRAKLWQQERRTRFTEFLVDHNPGQNFWYLFVTEGVAVLSFTGAVYLFLLRREALYLLWIPVVNSLGHLGYIATVMSRIRAYVPPPGSRFRAPPPPSLLLPLGIPAVILTVNVLILFYVWNLYRQRVLS